MLVIAQIIVSVILMVLILVQERSSGLSGILGGGGGTLYQARRGLEKTIYWLTIAMGAVFVILAIANLLSNS